MFIISRATQPKSDTATKHCGSVDTACGDCNSPYNTLQKLRPRHFVIHHAKSHSHSTPNPSSCKSVIEIS